MAVKTAKGDVANEFKLKGDGYEAKPVVELWPYRGGSRAAISAVVTTQPTSVVPGVSRIVDFQKAMDGVRAEVEKIIKS